MKRKKSATFSIVSTCRMVNMMASICIRMISSEQRRVDGSLESQVAEIHHTQPRCMADSYLFDFWFDPSTKI
jgi:hypothetical protein